MFIDRIARLAQVCTIYLEHVLHDNSNFFYSQEGPSHMTPGIYIASFHEHFSSAIWRLLSSDKVGNI